MAAPLHSDLVEGTPTVWPGGPLVLWRVAVGGGLAGAGGLLGRQGRLHGLLDEGVQVSGGRGGAAAVDQRLALRTRPRVADGACRGGLAAPALGRGWVGARRVTCWHVSSRPPFSTGRAAFTASGATPSDQSWSSLYGRGCRGCASLLYRLHPWGL